MQRRLLDSEIRVTNVYWVTLSNGGQVRVSRLNPYDVIAIGSARGFDASVVHRLEIAVQGGNLQVAVDGAVVSFQFVGTTVSVPATAGTNDGTAGIAFGASDNRGLIGGQRVTNVVVSPFSALGR